MIIAIDDDSATLELIEGALKDDGHKVVTFKNAKTALDWIGKQPEPDLIISDISMPLMDGFEFKKYLNRLFPNKNIPFLFLSSRSKTDDIVQGLDLGADDYIVKPVHPKILRAKIRSVMRTFKRYSIPMFTGDLAKFPFVKILQFCEMRKMFGHVEIISEKINTSIKFEAGEFIYGNDEQNDKTIEDLMELNNGIFKIFSTPVNFSEIEYASVTPEPAFKNTKHHVTNPSSSITPMGRLSAIKAGSKTFQIQTEALLKPEIKVVTIVVLDGRTVLKKLSDPLNSSLDITKIINTQHETIEKEVKEKLFAKIKNSQKTASSTSKENYNKLFENGLDEFMAKNYSMAVKYWKKAMRIAPENKALKVNLEIAENKLNNTNRK
jgi:DNA-binding response OmpR family regulator